MGCIFHFRDMQGTAELAAQSAQPSASDEEASGLRWKSTQSRSVSPESEQSTNRICLWPGALLELMPNDPDKSREVFTE
jgi:hypothetical protein